MYIYSIVTFTATILSTWVLADKQISTKPDESNVCEAFQKAGLISEMLPVPPKSFLSVEFADAEANLGNCICPVRSIIAPKAIIYNDVEPTALYTVVIASTDVPSADVLGLSDYLQSLCVNIKGASLNLYDGGQVVAPWINVNPSPGTGKQRVYALLYKQKYYIKVVDPYLVGVSICRARFSLNELVAKYSLGDPVAGNFWTTCIPNDYGKYCRFEYTKLYGKI